MEKNKDDGPPYAAGVMGRNFLLGETSHQSWQVDISTSLVRAVNLL